MQASWNAKEPEIDPSIEGFNVVDILEKRAIVMRKRRKKVRSKAALIAAAARELEKGGYDSLTIDRISEAAGMARGTFYLYFRNRGDITAAVMQYYWALARVYRPRGGSELPVRESIHRMNRFSAHVAMRNARLLRGRDTLIHENAAIARRLEWINKRWSVRIVRDMIRRGIVKPKGERSDFLHLKALAVINMSDALLRDIYQRPVGDTNRETRDINLVVEVMDELWFRALYMRIP